MGNQYARAVATASAGTEKSPIWRGLRAPEPLTSRQRRVVVLLAIACFPSSFVNTVFTQTVAFAASEFGVGEQGQTIRTDWQAPVGQQLRVRVDADTQRAPLGHRRVQPGGRGRTSWSPIAYGLYTR